MRLSDWGRLLLLAALWGGSFIFIRVVAPVLGPPVTVETRVLIAGVVLLAWSRVIGARLEIRRFWPQYLAIGALNSAIPFTLISAAELHLSASMAAILNATSPLFGALLAALWLKEPLTRAKMAGIALAFAGVVVLVGWSPLKLNLVTFLSIAASCLAAMSYGLAGCYTRAKSSSAPALGMAAGSQIGASLLLAPALPFAWPANHPSVSVELCLLALALLSTALAYLLYFRLIVDIGPIRALTVTFLTPIFGVAWGALFLGEPLSLSKLSACLLILAGTLLVTNLLPNSSAKMAKTAA